MSTNKPWELYDRLIEGIPVDIGVRNWGVGRRWSYVESESGTGIAMTVSGGGAFPKSGGFLGSESAASCTLDLRELAGHARSWCFEEASVGVAAINAYYNVTGNNPELAAWLKRNAQTDASADGSTRRQSDIIVSEAQVFEGKKVAVIGHFPHLEELSEVCELSILERRPSGGDFPDSACEYILPEQDLVVITGTALTNKTLVRLLDLSQNARVVIAGPSSVCSSILFDYGVDIVGGALVVDTDEAKRFIAQGVQLPFGHGLEMVRFSKTQE